MQQFKNTFLYFQKDGYQEIQTLGKSINSITFCNDPYGPYAYTVNTYPGPFLYGFVVYPGQKMYFTGKELEVYKGIVYINIYLWGRVRPPKPSPSIVVILKEFI